MARNLCIVNGRIGRDKNVGDFTCSPHCHEEVVLLTSVYVASEHFISDLSILDISEYSDHCPIILNIDICRDRRIFERVRAKSKVRQENSQLSILSTFTKCNNTLDREVKDCFNSSSFCSHFLSYQSVLLMK